MTTKTKQLALGIVGAIVVLVAILYLSHPARRAFREGFDSTAASPARTP